MKKRKPYLFLVFIPALVFTSVYVAYAWTPIAVENDSLVRMPGTQPGQAALEGPGRA